MIFWSGRSVILLQNNDKQFDSVENKQWLEHNYSTITKVITPFSPIEIFDSYVQFFFSDS